MHCFGVFLLFIACVVNADDASYKTASWTNLVTTTVTLGTYAFVAVNNGTTIVNNVTYAMSQDETLTITNCPCTLTHASVLTTTYSYNVYKSLSWKNNGTVTNPELTTLSPKTSSTSSLTGDATEFAQNTAASSSSSSAGAERVVRTEYWFSLVVWLLSFIAVV